MATILRSPLVEIRWGTQRRGWRPLVDEQQHFSPFFPTTPIFSSVLDGSIFESARVTKHPRYYEDFLAAFPPRLTSNQPPFFVPGMDEPARRVRRVIDTYAYPD